MSLIDNLFSGAAEWLPVYTLHSIEPGLRHTAAQNSCPQNVTASILARTYILQRKGQHVRQYLSRMSLRGYVWVCAAERAPCFWGFWSYIIALTQSNDVFVRYQLIVTHLMCM